MLIFYILVFLLRLVLWLNVIIMFDKEVLRFCRCNIFFLYLIFRNFFVFLVVYYGLFMVVYKFFYYVCLVIRNLFWMLYLDLCMLCVVLSDLILYFCLVVNMYDFDWCLFGCCLEFFLLNLILSLILDLSFGDW